MKNKILISLTLLICWLTNINALKISNLNAAVDSKSEKVIITYEIDEMADGASVRFLLYGGTSGGEYLDYEASGACGDKKIKPGKNTITWTPLKKHGCIMSEIATFQVKVFRHKTETTPWIESEMYTEPLKICVLGKEAQADPQYSFKTETDTMPLISPRHPWLPRTSCKYISKYKTSNVQPFIDVYLQLPDKKEVILEEGEHLGYGISIKIPSEYCQDGISKVIYKIRDPRRVVTYERLIRTRSNDLSLGELSKDEIQKEFKIERKSVKFERIFKWVKLTSDFDRTKAIRGVKVDISKPSNNNLYFSRQPNINLDGKSSEECKSLEQGYAYYNMLNTGEKTADGNYTGLISYLPMCNYEQPAFNGYDAWQGVGLNMPIVLQNKKSNNTYELFFIENDVYWGGRENTSLEIDGVYVFVEDAEALQTKVEEQKKKQVEADRKAKAEREERDKRDKEIYEKIAQLESQVIGRWSYEDRYGGVTFVFWAGGQFDFCAYGHKTRGSYSVWQNGEIHIRCSGENIVTYMESANKMRIIEGGNGEVYTKISDQPYQP